jgi:Tol biopolymer transport system component
MFFYRLVYAATPSVLQIEQLTQSGRVDRWERVTSDGSRLFFLERNGDRWESLEIATVGGESQPSRMPFPNTKILAISPDGSRFLVAPFTSLNGDMPLWITPVVGGAPRRIGDLTANDATFSPDGTQIALAKSGGIFVADLNGSNLRKIADLPGEHWYIAWSPDGKLIRFTQQIPNTSTSMLWEVTPKGKNLHALFPP